MSNNPDPQSRPPVQWSDADDRAMDALLKEYFRKQGVASVGGKDVSEKRSAARPVDFTDAILARLDQSRALSAEKITGGSGANRAYKPVVAAGGKRSGVAIAVRLIAVLAASILVFVTIKAWKSSDYRPGFAFNGTQNGNASGGDTETLPSDTDKVATADGASRVDAITSGDGVTQPVSPTKPRSEPIVLSLDRPQRNSDGAEGNGDPAANLAENAATAMPAGSDPVSPGRRELASSKNADLQDFDRQFLEYWKSIGVTPAPPVDGEALANRIADRFGFRPDVPTSAVDSAATGSGASAPSIVAVANELASSDLFSSDRQSRLLAERMVKQLGSGLKLSDDRKEQLVASAAAVIQSGGRFDQWISDWVASETTDSSPAAAPHLQAAAMGEWVAGRLMGADMGCARCHDSPIDSRFNQHDYWAFAAIFSPSPAQSVFYELPDGRQRVVTPGVPKRWLGLPRDASTSIAANATSVASRKDLAATLVGNRQLARSLVNHLWAIGFGSPMVSAASSPIAPPQDDSIELALEMLSDKLIEADFDIRVAARWVVQSEPMKRGTPVELQGDAWQLAGESQLVAASLAQRSFAAARSPWPAASQSQLLALMESRSGKQPAKLGARDAMLAQPMTTASGVDSGKSTNGSRGGKPPAKAVDHQDYWWTQWLADREGLKGGWMESIADRDQQVRHAFYAVGYRNVDQRQLEWGKSLLDSSAASGDSRNEEIAKIYWVIQNSM